MFLKRLINYFGEHKHYNNVIIVIDSNDKDLEKTVNVLIEGGYNVLRSMNGKEGIALIKRYKPDVIILDFLLSDMSIQEFFQKIKPRLLIKNAPKVLITSATIPHNILDYFEFGVDNYLLKPLSNNNLLEEIFV